MRLSADRRGTLWRCAGFFAWSGGDSARDAREPGGAARRVGLLVLPLHGDLSPAEQDRAITPAQQRKAILATNVAESSVTVEGVNAVIDSGLARIATYSQWTGLPTLHVGRVSKASAKQRAGRAGRTGPGRVLRLYGLEDYQRRPETRRTGDRARSDLSQLCLALRAMRIGDLEWLDLLRGSSAKRGGAARPPGARRKSGSCNWRGIRYTRGCHAFSSRPWSAEWARTAVSLRHCWDRARARRKMTCWQPSTRIRITGPGSRLSSCAGLPVLPGKRNTTTTHC